jgi:hypothetical protein
MNLRSGALSVVMTVVAGGLVAFCFTGAAYALTTPTISTSQQPGSAVVGSSIADKATVSGSSSFTCPPQDSVGFPLGTSNTSSNPIFCSYPAVSGEDPKDFYCEYSATTGALVTDHDAGLCPANAVGPNTNPTGTVTFKLYNNSSGSGTPLFTDTESLVSGVATSAGYTTTATGTDYWVATYNGDSNNNPVTSSTSGEPVTITPALLLGAGGGSVTASLTGLSQSHRRWRLGNNLARFAVASQPPIGTTFQFTLNEAATVQFAFAKVLHGRKVNGKCVAQTRRNRRHKACERSVPSGSLSFSAGVGPHKLFFQGRLTRTKTLKPGTYALTITATNANGQQATSTLSFAIVPG